MSGSVAPGPRGHWGLSDGPYELIRDVAYCSLNEGGRVARDTAEAEAGMKGITQLIDAEARGFAEDKLMLVLTEFDSSSWNVRAVDERVLGELRHHYPGAEDL